MGIIFCSQRQSRKPPPACSRNSRTVKAGTKNRSNCSRERCAGKDFGFLRVEKRRTGGRLAQFSNSSFSSRSRSSSASGTSSPRPPGADADENSAHQAGESVAIARHGISNRSRPATSTSRLISPFFCSFSFHYRLNSVRDLQITSPPGPAPPPHSRPHSQMPCPHNPSERCVLPVSNASASQKSCQFGVMV